jgi:hypothetical protein
MGCFYPKEWRKITRLIKDLLGILGILIVLLEIYRLVRRKWLRRLLDKKKKEKRPRKPPMLRPKSERGNLPGIAGYAWRKRENEEASSKKHQFPGSCAKVVVGERKGIAT